MRLRQSRPRWYDGFNHARFESWSVACYSSRTHSVGASSIPSRARPARTSSSRAAVFGIKLRVPAFGPHRLTVDEEREHRCGRLNQVARCHDDVRPFADFERADLVGDTKDLCRCDRDGLECNIHRQSKGDRRSGFEGKIARRGFTSTSPAGSRMDGHRNAGGAQLGRIRVRRVVRIVGMPRQVERAARSRRANRPS